MRRFGDGRDIAFLHSTAGKTTRRMSAVMTYIVRVVLMLDVEAQQKEEGAAKRAAEAHILEHLQPLIEQHA